MYTLYNIQMHVKKKKKVEIRTFEVESASTPGSFYRVTRHSDGLWSCKRKDNGYPCKAFLFGGMKGKPHCKHIKGVQGDVVK
jgi:hypothetical protein